MALAPDLITPPVLDADEIVEEYTQRQKRFRDRDSIYDEYISYYDRKRTGGSGGLPILSANAQGRPLLRPVGESINSRRTYSSQRLSPVVDDYAALMGRMPTTRVEPPDPGEAGEKKAELLTKYLYSTYELSRMGYQQAQAGHFLSLLGDAVYVLEPEPEHLRVVWNVVSPRNCWPSFYHGYRRFEVFDLMITELWTPRELKKQWGVTPENDKPEFCTVVTYVSPHQRTVLVGTRLPQRVAHVEWDLGFCPVVWTFNKVTGVMGMSDIAQSLGQQDFLDFCLNVWADGIVHMTYPMLAIKNPTNMGQDQITIGPGAPPVILQGDGDLIVRQTQADPRALESIIQQTLQDINAATGTSQVRQEGKMQSSITTGRAVQSVQGPQSTRVEFKQQVLGDAIQTANRMTLAMQEKAPFLRGFKGAIFGNYHGTSFVEEFNAAKDIDGWYRTKVSWQALVGMNLQQKTAVAYEGMVAKIWDDIEAREMVGIEDPLGMRKRIETQLLMDARLQGKMQQNMGGQAGAQQGQAGNAGGQPQQPGQAPAPPLFRPPQLGGGQSGGAAPQPQTPSAPSQNDWVNALAPIADKLRGTVWLAPTGQLLISDHRDYQAVLEVARKLSPEAKVKQMAESKMPEGATKLL